MGGGTRFVGGKKSSVPVWGIESERLETLNRRGGGVMRVRVR